MQTQMLKDVMTRDVLVIGPEATVKEAAARMRDDLARFEPVGHSDDQVARVCYASGAQHVVTDSIS